MNTHSATAILDVRILPPWDRHPTIFNTFEALSPGEILLLINDHDPAPLRYQFEVERPGEFSWDYIEKGPEMWQVHITKQAG